MVAVILDGGHGFETKGKRSRDGSLRENEYNNAIVNKVAYVLYKKSIPYRIVSSEWSDVPLLNRIQREHLFNQELKDMGYSPIFISIHANAARSSNAEGYETFIVNDASNATLNLGEIVHKEVYSAYKKHSKKAKDRSLKKLNFYVLRNTKSPAVLIECGFMTNEQDLELLKSDLFRNDITDSLIKAIENYDIYSERRDS
tara:strand:+ start:4927 stop:5526 length:600 start_codon:yes stop_codon:yes gene_type:complete